MFEFFKCLLERRGILVGFYQVFFDDGFYLSEGHEVVIIQ